MTTKILSGLYQSVYNLAAPITTLSITASGYLGGGLIAAGAGAYSIVSHGTISGSSFGVSLAGNGSVDNRGLIHASSGSGVYLRQGGVVTNGSAVATASLIAGTTGVMAGGLAARVTNFGSILATGAGVELRDAAGTLANYGLVSSTSATLAAVGLLDGGVVINGSDTRTGARIQGAYGVDIEGAVGSVSNFGTILARGAYYYLDRAVFLEAGGAVTNGGALDTGALIDGPVAVEIDGAAGTVTNHGTIGGLVTIIGVYLRQGGLVTNAGPAALIGGYAGVEIANDSG
ncbi:MAG: hypothetical protein ACR2FH_04615, partial [Caulobacteraceae bacterium]